ncbi:HlyD family type I secretion periplasmic adaptor subunit [Alteromonas sp.]|uniref:HlyD family type I secretion periplasmic adaptor subunit n=1 Tax=Alteromonas sp. TaxID=232 RepID=UPI00257B9612|nr:HlyD family type I secretion periplasmic adaptor subunit [Alteromonas sp.]NQY18763.1 HlyD family type I secretion periplasmic adaptor subunit [Alteromonas sp.]|tara:strand:+ start:355 stop:1665 length:1311 start_codon:yes stop_codon:yes gene_type:complete
MNIANDDLPKIKTSLKGPIVSGLTILLIFLVGATAWASSAKLASAIIAVGQLKVDSNRKQIQHLDGGIVNQILVSDGQSVKKGDTLVILDPVQAKSSLGIVAGALFTAELKRSRLQAERDNTEQPDFTRFLHREHEDKNSLIDAQQSLFSIRRSVQVSQQEILHQQIENLKSQISGFESQQASTQTQIEISKDELVNLKNLKARGLVGNERLLELERNLAQLEGRAGELVSSIASAKASIDEKRLELIRVKRSFHEQVLAELQDVESEIIDLQERANAATHHLQQMVVKAPVDGLIVGLNVHTEGGVVVPGQLLMEIVPDNDALIVEGQVLPTDVDDLLVGQSARVKLSGLQQRTTPELTGMLQYVSADSMLDERSGMTYFIIRVSIAAEELAKLPSEGLIPGMPAEVFVQTGERTALEYLLQPLSDTIDRAWREK